MQRAELRDGGRLLGDTLGELSDVARDVHTAVARRVFAAIGPVAAPARVLHDAISATAYTAARLGANYLPVAAATIAAHRGAPSVESVADTPRGHFAVSALNGILGDQIAQERTSLAPLLRLRTQRGRLCRLPGNVAHDQSGDSRPPTGKLVVFLHGLCESDRFWWYGAERSWQDPEVTYGSLLRDERDWTPLYAHYNTGLRISENGRLLAGYLQTLVEAWPVPVTEVALVGHSMGGLVARSAAHQADEHGLGWRATLHHIVGLGTPHLGAPLERWVNAGAHTLAKLPETRPFARLLNMRSVGIKDLRYGSVVEADWLDHDPDERLADHCTPATLLPGVTYSMVSATLSARPTGVLAHDLLVEHVSAHGTGRRNATRRIEFEIDRLLHVGNRTHFHLLNDPAVYEHLRAWLEAP